VRRPSCSSPWSSSPSVLEAPGGRSAWAASLGCDDDSARRDPEARALRPARPRSSPLTRSAGSSLRRAPPTRLRYPQVGVPTDPGGRRHDSNTLLRDKAEAAVRDFTSGIGKDPQAGPNQPSTLQVDYSVASDSPDLIQPARELLLLPVGRRPRAATCSRPSPSTLPRGGSSRLPTCSDQALRTRRAGG